MPASPAQDKACDEQRAAAVALAAALARAGGGPLWVNAGAGWEECCKACSAALEDPFQVGVGLRLPREAAAWHRSLGVRSCVQCGPASR
jgi:hypothetical protein